MNSLRRKLWYLIAALAGWSNPAYAAVHIVSIVPSAPSPQSLGTQLTWTVTAKDDNPGPLTFQFNVAYGSGAMVMTKDFNVGTLNGGVWISQPFVWTPTDAEGTHQILFVIKDFNSGETVSHTVPFQVTTLVSNGNPVVKHTANPLVALFSAPSCPSGNSMRVIFNQAGVSAATATGWASCHPPLSMAFEIAGMYPNTKYAMHAQTVQGTQVVNGPALTFTTGALPPAVTFPPFTVNIPPGAGTDTTDGMILHALTPQGTNYFGVATDLLGNINWYYLGTDSMFSVFLTRPIPNGRFLTLQNGTVWNPASQVQQLLREVDLAGNIIQETNIGVLQQELLAMGASDAGPCNTIPSPAPVGSSCLTAFHHDAIRLPNGYIVAMCKIEKIFPPGTQGDTSGLPVDVLADMFVVLNSNWQVVWYFDSLQHDGGGSQLDINRPAVLGETCVNGSTACPPIFLLGPGIAPAANDWLHCNSLYYWPQNGDIILSSRDQDWVMKIDYNNGSGTGNILWRMGQDGDFTFNNIDNDPWPWFSHQHDVGMENSGAGPLTVFDNGNTRVAPPPIGLGSGDSRGMALTVDENSMQVTPVLSVDLGVYASALGSAQLLLNGNYFFQPGIPLSYDIEILPTPGTLSGTQVLNIQGAISYRSWQMSNLYSPPTT